MNPHKGEVLSMAITSQPNQETQELTRIFHQKKTTLLIRSNKDMTELSVKSVLSTFATYEPNHESPPFSINDTKDVMASFISVIAAIQDPKYHVNPNKPVI